jgi:hypothetical protein
MPRSELNNPSIRMDRVLDEMADWIAYAKALEARLIEIGAPMEGLPVTPTQEEYKSERLRAQHLRGKRRRARNYIARVRAVETPTLQQRFPATQAEASELSAEVLAQVENLLKQGDS